MCICAPCISVSACRPCDGSYNKCRLCQDDKPNGWWTPEQVLEGVSVSGKTYMVTGGNSGIGFVTAQTLLAAGAEVIVSTRSAAKTEDTINRLLQGLPLTAKERIKGVSFDLGSLKSIQSGVKEFEALGVKRLDALCLNAGVMALPEFNETDDGLEKQWGVNHVGHFYLFKLLLPTIEKLPYHTRIVIVASTAHNLTPNDFSVETHIPPKRENYGNWSNYGISKISNILMAKEITKRFDGTKLSAYALHPGVIMGTNLQRHMPICAEFVFNCCAYLHCCCLWNADYKNLRTGASNQLFLMTQPLENLKNGGYYAGCILQDRNSVNYKTALVESNEEAKRLWDATEKIIAELVGSEL